MHRHRGLSEHQADRNGPRPSGQNDFLHLAEVRLCWFDILRARGAYAKQTPVPESPRQVAGLVFPQLLGQALDRFRRVERLEAGLALVLEWLGPGSRPTVIRSAEPARAGPTDL